MEEPLETMPVLSPYTGIWYSVTARPVLFLATVIRAIGFAESLIDEFVRRDLSTKSGAKY